MKRPVHVFDAESGIVVGEIHAQYIPRVSNEDKSLLIGTSATQASRTECGTTMPNVSQSSDHQTTLMDGKTASCSTQVEQNGTCCTKNRTVKIRGLETIDTEISILSTEILEPQVQESKSEREVENEYFTKHPLMRLFLCGACCSSKKRKIKKTEKRGLMQRMRRIFHRNN
ncbi:uncharacterized protein LOC134249098 [Saccostrea cucullata]|uniref:uncharacterized protein LOC134249098 n=1 Tax=Saccostrea cuccullata TaxID=36930 RepID=UPI002ED67203